MKRKIIIVGAFIVSSTNNLVAQHWAMDEAYDDWRDTSSESFSIGGLVVLAVVIGVVWIISIAVKVAKEEHTKKEEQRKKNEKKTDDIVSSIDQIIDSINQKKE